MTPIRHYGILAAGFCAAALAAPADDVRVTGPRAGAVYDPRTQTIRSITGVAGASRLGDALADQIDAAAIAPNGKLALAVRDAALYSVSGLDGPDAVWTQLAPALAAIDRIVWNRDSSSAAVYSAANRSILLIRNFTDAAPGQITISLDSLTGDVTALSLENSGAAAIVALTGEAGGVYLVSPESPPALLASIARPTAMDFIHQDRDLIVADADTLQIFELRDYRGAAQLTPFAALPDGASQPIALATSPNSRFVFVADRACRCIPVYEYSTRTIMDRIVLSAQPYFLTPVSNGRLFLVNSPADGATPLWMLEPGETPAVYFVSGGTQ